MSKYGEKVRREQSVPFEIQASRDGLVRIYYAESKMIDEAGESVLFGPWCINEDYARRWWTSSETARQMREGTKLGASA